MFVTADGLNRPKVSPRVGVEGLENLDPLQALRSSFYWSVDKLCAEWWRGKNVPLNCLTPRDWAFILACILQSVLFSFVLNVCWERKRFAFRGGRGEDNDILNIQGCFKADDAVTRCDDGTVSILFTRSLQDEDTFFQQFVVREYCPLTADSSIFSLLSSQNGGYPTTIVCNKTPQDHKSTGHPIGSSKIVSGAKNIGAPLAWQRMTSESLGSLKANPKSPILASMCWREPGTGLDMRRILSGLMSLWTILLEWR